MLVQIGHKWQKAYERYRYCLGKTNRIKGRVRSDALEIAALENRLKKLRARVSENKARQGQWERRMGQALLDMQQCEVWQHRVMQCAEEELA